MITNVVVAGKFSRLSNAERKQKQQQIKSLLREINQLSYQLYGGTGKYVFQKRYPNPTFNPNNYYYPPAQRWYPQY